MRIGFIIVVLALPGCGAEMKEFSPDGTFSVIMAGNPKVDTQSILGLTTTSYTVEERNGVYGISVTDYPSDRPWIQEETEGRLKAVREVITTSNKARVTHEEDIKLADRHPGRRIEAKRTERDGVLRARVFAVKGRLFQLTAVGSKNWANSDSINRFLDSLTVKE